MRICILIAALCAASAAVAGPNGRVEVVDGDSFRVGGQSVRLFGIDAPEADQTCTRADGTPWACGRWAAAEVRRLYEGRRATCETLTYDQYDRAVARCEVRGRDVAADIVRAGLATAYLRYSDDYADEEKDAIVEGAGIFGGAFTRPEDHRTASRQPAAPQASGNGCTIKGNISNSGRIYHLPGQENYARTRIDPTRGERWFCSEAEARAAGWRRAGR